MTAQFLDVARASAWARFIRHRNAANKESILQYSNCERLAECGTHPLAKEQWAEWLPFWATIRLTS